MIEQTNLGNPNPKTNKQTEIDNPQLSSCIVHYVHRQLFIEDLQKQTLTKVAVEEIIMNEKEKNTHNTRIQGHWSHLIQQPREINIICIVDSTSERTKYFCVSWIKYE